MTSFLVWDLETTGLEPAKDRILCITVDGESFIGEDEARLLQAFWNHMSPGVNLIGFNSKGFDWQFVLMRTFIKGIKLPFSQDLVNHTDLREVFCPYNKFMKGKLGEIAAGIGLEVKTDNGPFMMEHYVNGNWKEIQAHCSEDVKITSAIYDRLIKLGYSTKEVKNEK